MSTPGYRNLTTLEVKQKLDQGEPIRLIDVRELEEHQIAQIEGAELLPMSQFQEWAGTLPRDQEVVIFCHHGGRSQQIASYLSRQLGYTNLANMLGGIEDWSIRIDSHVPRY